MELLNARVHRREFVRAGAGAVLATFGLPRLSRGAGTPVVRFAYFATEAEHAAYEQLVSAFEEDNPNIAIESIALPSGDATLMPIREMTSPYQPWLRTVFSTDHFPDVFLLNYRNLGEFASRSLVEPLDSYLEASKTLHADDFYPNALYAFRYRTISNSQLSGIPQNASSLVVYYNKDVFEEFGLPYPTDTWTWSDFASIASTLTVDRDQDGVIGTYGVAIEPSISRVAAFIWGAGGDFVDDPVTPTKVEFDSSATQEALNWLVSLGQAGLKVTPSEAMTLVETDLSRFQSGRAAMFVHTRRVVPSLRAQTGLRWDVAPLPLGKVPANVLHTDGFCLASHSRQKDAAWTFIEFANGPKGQAVLAATGRTVPSLKSVAESDVFLRGSSVMDQIGLNGLTLPPSRTRVFVDNIAISRALPAVSSWPGVEWAFDRSFRQAFYNDGDVTGAVQRITARTTGILGTPLTTPRNLFVDEANQSEE